MAGPTWERVDHREVRKVLDDLRVMDFVRVVVAVNAVVVRVSVLVIADWRWDVQGSVMDADRAESETKVVAVDTAVGDAEELIYSESAVTKQKVTAELAKGKQADADCRRCAQGGCLDHAPVQGCYCGEPEKQVKTGTA